MINPFPRIQSGKTTEWTGAAAEDWASSGARTVGRSKTRRPLVSWWWCPWLCSSGLWPSTSDRSYSSEYRTRPLVVGEAVFLATLAAASGAFGASGRRTLADEPSAEEPCVDTAAARLILWALRLAMASLVLPIMENPDAWVRGLGFRLDKSRRCAGDPRLGQFPWWTLVSGGFHCRRTPDRCVSIATPLVLALGLDRPSHLGHPLPADCRRGAYGSPGSGSRAVSRPPRP